MLTGKKKKKKFNDKISNRLFNNQHIFKRIFLLEESDAKIFSKIKKYQVGQ